MSHYYATAQGNRSAATRCGHKSTGIIATANSWSIGAEISIQWSDQLQTDIVTLYSTRGSNATSSRIMSYAIIDDELQILDTNYPELLL